MCLGIAQIHRQTSFPPLKHAPAKVLFFIIIVLLFSVTVVENSFNYPLWYDHQYCQSTAPVDVELLL